MEYLSLCSGCNFHNDLFVVFSFFVYIDCHKRGQTSRPVAWAQIQTTCNFKANICDCNCFLGCLHFLLHNVVMELPNILMVWLYSYTTVSSNFDLILHKDFLNSVSSSNSDWRRCSRTTEPNKSPEHSAIQVSSALWLQLILVVCYLPHGIVAPLTTHSGQSSSDYLARQYTSTLLFLNSSINPILYCWKIREVRQAAKDTIRQQFCFSS